MVQPLLETAVDREHPRKRHQDQKRLRILFTPHEICGQMQLLAEALRKQGHDATAVNYYADFSPLQRKNDVNLGLVSGQRTPLRAAKMLKFTFHAARKYDVFHFFFGESMLPGNWDLPMLKRLGKRIFVHFRGSDIRQGKYLETVVQQRLQGLAVESEVPLSSSSQLRKIRTWRKFADSMFVSIPELLEVIPEAIVVQQAIALEMWEFDPEPLGSVTEEIIVGHAPTSRSYKGSQFLIDAVEALKASGYPVKLKMMENIPHAQMKVAYKQCDIVVDQLLQSSYGNVSIESMALGKPVIAHLDSWYANHRPDLPIVSATPLNLTEKLKMLIHDQPLRRRLGEQGRAYVEKYHDVNVITRQLLDVYQSSESPSRTRQVVR